MSDSQIKWKRICNGFGPMQWVYSNGHFKVKIIRIYRDYRARYGWYLLQLGKEQANGTCTSLADAKTDSEKAYTEALNS